MDSKLFVIKLNSKVLYYVDNKIKIVIGILKFNIINMLYDGKYYILSIFKNNIIIIDLVIGEFVRIFYNSNNDFFILFFVISKDNKKVVYSESKNKIIIMNMYFIEEFFKMVSKILKG